MGKQERNRWGGNEKARELLQESKKRALSPDEITILKRHYSGYGGLYSNGYSGGQFFTPPVVTRFVVDLLQISGKVLEPSCGGGAFIEQLPASCDVVGIEQVHETAEVARLCYPNASIISGDALAMLEQFRGQFDAVIGNPPYVKVRMQPDYVGYEFSAPSKKAEWMFIELALHALKPGGVLAMVVSDGILSNNSELPMRSYILEKAIVRAVVSLPRETFYHTGTTVKPSVLVVQKKALGVEYGNYTVFMGICEDIGWTGRGKDSGKCDLPKILEAFRHAYPYGIRPDTVHSAADERMPTEAEMREADIPSEAQNHEAPPAPIEQREGMVSPGAAVERSNRPRKRTHEDQMALQF